MPHSLKLYSNMFLTLIQGSNGGQKCFRICSLLSVKSSCNSVDSRFLKCNRGRHNIFLAFPSISLPLPMFVHSVPHVKRIHDQKLMHQQALQLVKCLCNHMVLSTYSTVEQIFVEATIVAAWLGIREVIEVIVEAFPVAILAQEATTEHQTFDLAVKNRCEKVFNLIYQMSDHKHRLVGTGATILHLAAGLAPSHKLNQVSGAALQMQRELQWFKVTRFIL